MSSVAVHDYYTVPKYIYNHDIMNCTADGVVGNHLYSGRALGITEPWDLIQLHSDLKPLWNDIIAHYDHVGLSHTKNVTWYLNLQQLGSHIGYHPSVFYFGPDEYTYWGDYEWYKTVDFINSKNNFMSLASELGIETPKTLCFDSTGDIVDSAIKDMPFPCYLKAAISVSGVGIYRCEDMSELKANLVNFDRSTPVQIQEEINTNVFLNLQYRVMGDELIRLNASEQLLDGFVHQGNRAPACYEPWENVEPMALWLKEKGMKEIFAFDIAVVETDNGVRFPAIECNPRFNGASYPTLIAQKLGIPEWSAVTFSTKHTRLNKINMSDIEYDKKTGEGAIIVNWGTILTGKLMILMAGSRDYQDALKIELEAQLC